MKILKIILIVISTLIFYLAAYPAQASEDKGIGRIIDISTLREIGPSELYKVDIKTNPFGVVSRSPSQLYGGSISELGPNPFGVSIEKLKDFGKKIDSFRKP